MSRKIINDGQNATFLTFATVVGWWVVVSYADHFSQIVRALVIGVASLIMFLIAGKVSGNHDQPKNRAAGTISVLLAVGLLIALPSLHGSITDLLLTLCLAALVFSYRDLLPRNMRKALATMLCGCLIYYLDDFGFPFAKPIGWSLFTAGGLIFLLRLFTRSKSDLAAARS